MTGIIPDDEDDVAVPSRIAPYQMSDVDPGSRVRRDLPGRRNGPVATIDQVRRVIRNAGGLRLGKRHRGGKGGYLASAIPAVIPDAIDIDGVDRRVRVDFEEDSLALVHADVSGKTLDRQIARAAYIPLARGVPWLRIFADDVVRHRGIAAKSLGVSGTRKD